MFNRAQNDQASTVFIGSNLVEVNLSHMWNTEKDIVCINLILTMDIIYMTPILK